MSPILEIICFILIVCVVVCVFFTITGTISYFYGKNVYCPRVGENLNLPVKYDFWGEGCYVQLENGQWIDNDNYRGVIISK